MYLKTQSGRLIELPSDEEEAEINAGIAADPDTYEMGDDEFAQLRHLPPPRIPARVHTGLRLDADVAEAFKSTGSGWQSRVNAALREWLATRREADAA